MMTGKEETVKKKKLPKALRVKNECHMPGVGDFKAGEVIEDAAKIEAISDNPNFEIVSEGGK